MSKEVVSIRKVNIILAVITSLFWIHFNKNKYEFYKQGVPSNESNMSSKLLHTCENWRVTSHQTTDIGTTPETYAQAALNISPPFLDWKRLPWFDVQGRTHVNRWRVTSHQTIWQRPNSTNMCTGSWKYQSTTSRLKESTMFRQTVAVCDTAVVTHHLAQSLARSLSLSLKASIIAYTKALSAMSFFQNRSYVSCSVGCKYELQHFNISLLPLLMTRCRGVMFHLSTWGGQRGERYGEFMRCDN